MFSFFVLPSFVQHLSVLLSQLNPKTRTEAEFTVDTRTTAMKVKL